MKGIKDFLKNWILAHERAYWYIIFGIAVGLFALITAIGVGKVYSAEAAEVEPMAVIDGISIPDIRTFDWSAYAEHFETEYGYTGDIGEKIVREHKYCIITVNPYLWENKNPYFTYLFTNEPVQYSDNSFYWLLADWNTSFAFEYRNGEVNTLRGYGLNAWDGSAYGYGPDLISFRVGSNNNSCITIASTYDFRNGQLSYHDSYQQISYPEKNLENVYDTDAPYVSFKKLVVDNKMIQGVPALAKVDNLYSEYFAPSTWTYHGTLHNVSSDDVSYQLNLEFVVELPTIDYVRRLYAENGYDTSSGRNVLLHNKKLVEYWNSDTKADSRTVRFEYSLDLVPDQFDEFSYSFTFMEWEYLLRAYGNAIADEIAGYDAHWRSILLSFIHVKQITSEVVTTRSDCIVYGGYTSNLFKRGVYDSCAEAYTKADKNFVDSDLLEDWITDDLRDAEQQYIKDLEDRVNELENQMNGVGDAFGGNLETTNIWSSFTGLIKGLSGIAPAVGVLSSLTGVVLAFLPLEISTIMASTLLAICVIALVKAIRG